MAWLPKRYLALLPWLLSLNAHAQKIQWVNGATDLSARIVSQERVVDNSPLAFDVHFELPGIDVEEAGDGFQSVKATGLFPLAIEGNPDLAGTGVLMAIPEGYEPSIQIVERQEREIPGILTRPLQKKFRCGKSPQVSFAFNAPLYRSKAVYPAEEVIVQEMGRLQNLRIARVGILPLRADLGRRTLLVTTKLRLNVSFKPNGQPTDTVVLPPALYQLVSTMVANRSEFGLRVVEATGPEVMVVVVADALKETIQPWIDWKATKGLRLDVVTYTQAGGSKEKVRDYLKNYFNKAATKPSYLVFVGNKETMPAFMESTGSGNAASDWQFSKLANDDNIPDVLYGRLLADNAEEAKTQVTRWIDYEKNPTVGDWMHDGTTIGSADGSDPSDKEYAIMIQEALKAGTYRNVDGFYQGDKTATFANISKSVNAGRTWLAYFGHGSGTSWGSTNDSFGNTQVDKLENTDKLPIVIDVACMNASWVKVSKCFGKSWVTGQKNGRATGAVAFYGGSVNISWHEPAVMSVGVAKYHFEKPVHTLGGSVLAGQLHLFEKMGTEDNTLDNLKWYNLFGDPSLLVRTDVPKTFRVESSWRTDKKGVEITVEAKDDQGHGVEGLLVALSSNQKDLQVTAKTDKNGTATLVVPGLTSLPEHTTLTATGYNTQTVQTEIE